LNTTWRSDDSTINDYPYNPQNIQVGLNPDIIDALAGGSPYDFFSFLVDNNILFKIVTETNRFAAQKIASFQNLSPHSRLRAWYDTDIGEIKNFLGVVLWMGLVQLPSYDHYWSTSPVFHTNVGRVMSRNRFEIIMQMIHFMDNEQADKSNRLYKLGTLVEDLTENYNICYIPEESLCIDESVIPFMGRLLFKQYIKNKSHKYGVKIFKLCVPPCYTLAMKVYAGKETDQNISVSAKVVLDLAAEYLNFGRTMYVDNWYTSVHLADLLGEQKTHLVGTLRSNRKKIQKKLKKGESCSMRSSSNILVMKWKDKRDLLMLSTKHDSRMIQIPHRNKKKNKTSSGSRL